MLMQIIVLLSWLALPVGLLCVVDDWFLRPRRQIAAAPQEARDPPLMSFAYHALPILIGAAVLRLLVAERLDFSAVLFGITVLTGVVWLLDAVVLQRRRAAAARAAGKDPALIREPGTVDYARSFFPVALVVLVLRSFIFEPFRIPSDSMMPTLLDGDFIIVNKYAYGLRLPVINRKIVAVGSPQRGDVVVFRYPLDPSVNYIKRLVGLPGDHVEVRNDKITVNGQPVPFKVLGLYNDGCYVNFQLAQEQLGGHTHQAMLCPVPLDVSPAPLPGCNRKEVRGYNCSDAQSAAMFAEPQVFSRVVPPGQYLMMGDNRDNSEDGRVWGFVPEQNLVGKATRIWFNWDPQRSGGPTWSRMGSAIK
ncbi:MAG: Signal peptidase [Gammaproteobacteria bacterium]|jgi:signal peptidase I|nr:Signal peptidase [Gammaproteobacteria bacterium]